MQYNTLWFLHLRNSQSLSTSRDLRRSFGKLSFQLRTHRPAQDVVLAIPKFSFSPSSIKSAMFGSAHVSC